MNWKDHSDRPGKCLECGAKLPATFLAGVCSKCEPKLHDEIEHERFLLERAAEKRYLRTQRMCHLCGKEFTKGECIDCEWGLQKIS